MVLPMNVESSVAMGGLHVSIESLISGIEQHCETPPSPHKNTEQLRNKEKGMIKF